MDIVKASTLAILHTINAPGIALLPRELLYALFTAAGLDEAGHWRFEEQRKTNNYSRELIVDAVFSVTGFAACDDTERVAYRMEGRVEMRPIFAKSGSFPITMRHTPVLTVTTMQLEKPSLRPPLYGAYSIGPRERVWHWSNSLMQDPVFCALLETKQMKHWMLFCEKWIELYGQ